VVLARIPAMANERTPVLALALKVMVPNEVVASTKPEVITVACIALTITPVHHPRSPFGVVGYMPSIVISTL